MHKGLPRISSTPASLYAAHMGSYGSDLWKLALEKGSSVKQGSLEFAVQEVDYEGSDRQP